MISEEFRRFRNFRRGFFQFPTISKNFAGLPDEFQACPFVPRVTDEIPKSWSILPGMPAGFRVFPFVSRIAHGILEP
jgi:hypothetical protein